MATADGLWSDPANWSTGAVPQAGDDVVINQPGNIQVTLDGSVSVNSVTLTSDTLAVQSGAILTTTANLTNSGSIAVSPDGQIVVGGNYTQAAGASLSMPGGGSTMQPLANLLANADFESPVIASDGTTPPDGWSASGSAALSDVYAYTGVQSLQMSGPNSSVYQSIAVTPGSSYTLSIDVMSPPADRLTGSEAAFYQIVFFDGGGNQLTTTPPVFAFGQGRAPGGALVGNVGNSGWNAFNTSAVAPVNAASAEAVLIANATNGTGPGGGSTYWDDPQFGPSAPAPSTFSAAAISNSGSITLGPANTITTTGAFTQTATGTLDIQLGGAPATGEFGFVKSTGVVTLAGTLEADVVYGYVPSTTDDFTPIEFPSETGSFASMQLAGGDGYQFYGAVTFTNVVLSAVPTTPLTTTVNTATTLQAANPALLGTNMNWWDPAEVTTQMQTLVKAAGLPLYAFPGGSNTDDIHFNNSTDFGVTTATTIPQFAQFIQAVGGVGMVTLDYGSASPQEAAAELAYLEGNSTDTTPLGIGIEWNDKTSQWQNVDWKTVGYWASLRGAAPLATNDGLNFLRIKHSAPFSNIKYAEIGNEQYGSWEIDHHGTPGPGGVSTGAQHDPATYATFAAQFASYASEILTTAGLPPISIGINSGDPTGRSDNNWTQNVLTIGLSLGFVPGYLSDHDFVQQPTGEGDENLLVNTVSNPASNDDWSTRYAAYQSLLQQTIPGQAAGVQVLATGYNSVYGDPGKQSTSLVDGLFLADSIGSMLDSGYSGALIWDLTNGWEPSFNNNPGLYGWREGGDQGLIGDSHTKLSPSTGAYIPYPSYFAEQLGSKFVQTGGVAVSAISNYQQFDSYAVMEPNGHLDLLVINADPAASLTEQFNLQGFQPSGQAQFWQYGETQDTAQSHSASGASALASFSTTLNLTGSNFSYAFPAYSMTVIDLAPETAPTVAKAVAANPNPVAAKTTALSVLGAENGNDSILTYTWSVAGLPNGAASPTFSANGTNAAKNFTATFFAAGSYTFKVTITDVNQASITSSVNVVVKQTLTRLTLSPTSSTLAINTTQQFSAHGFDQFNAAMPATVAWTLVKGSVGTIGSGGLYSAGASSGSATIHAASGSVAATAPVTVIAATVSGTVFNDANANGSQASTEKGIASRTVYLEISGQGTKGERTTTTNSAGAFSFTNLAAGKYVLIVPTPSGWRSTTALATGDPLTLAAGAKVASLLFGQTQLALVSGSVYLDANRDGKEQTTEAGLAGWTVQLLSTTSSSVKFTTTTNTSGAYNFGAVAAGSYKLSLTPRSGFTATSPASNSYSLKLSAGQTLAGENFGQKAK
jgi:hypothetical protein